MYKITISCFVFVFQRKDFIQLMIEAAELGEEEDGDGDDSKEKSTTKKKEPLTIDELIGQV